MRDETERGERREKRERGRGHQSLSQFHLFDVVAGLHEIGIVRMDLCREGCLDWLCVSDYTRVI